MSQQYSQSDMIKEIRRVADETGREVPRSTDMREIGNISVVTIANRFGSWNDAIKQAGLSVNKESPGGPSAASREELIEDLHRVAEVVNGAPTYSEMQEHGEYSFTAYLRNIPDTDGLGKWNQILTELDYGLNRVNQLFERECDICETTMHLRKCEVEMGYHLCSRQCYHEYQSKYRVGEERYNYKEESTDYGPGWNFNKKERVREMYDRECQACGMTGNEHKDEYGRRLSVHHIIPASSFDNNDPAQNEVTNLVPLCMKHHRKWEGIPLEPQFFKEGS